MIDSLYWVIFYKQSLQFWCAKTSLALFIAESSKNRKPLSLGYPKDTKRFHTLEIYKGSVSEQKLVHKWCTVRFFALVPPEHRTDALQFDQNVFLVWPFFLPKCWEIDQDRYAWHGLFSFLGGKLHRQNKANYNCSLLIVYRQRSTISSPSTSIIFFQKHVKHEKTQRDFRRIK